MTSDEKRYLIRLALIAVAVLFVIIVLAGCSTYQNERGKGDAPVGPVDDAPVEIVNMPDGYRNVATKCNHGHRIYQGTDPAARVNTVIPNDPSCPRT